jgi:hypothetical protein
MSQFFTISGRNTSNAIIDKQSVSRDELLPTLDDMTAAGAVEFDIVSHADQAALDQHIDQ